MLLAVTPHCRYAKLLLLHTAYDDDEAGCSASLD